jgi:2-hydroxy-3-keto-5-methylthiopentenyl-1-phosphate phosphatase
MQDFGPSAVLHFALEREGLFGHAYLLANQYQSINEGIGVMNRTRRKYRAMISSDWNECLAPCGPFDFISFTYPHLEPELAEVFREYTGVQISFSEAIRRITSKIPAPLTEKQMDSYLDECFETYSGVPELMEWCAEKSILFMINTTGMQGYFQRVIAKALLPALPIVSASPTVRYPARETDPKFYDLTEIKDKGKNTEAAMHSFGIASTKVILAGDSGGDGPHFEWGAKVGAFLIGSMTKWSLDQYCSGRGIKINLHFGLSYSEGKRRNKEKERDVDFMDLIPKIEAIL